jgi:hypothetical protein
MRNGQQLSYRKDLVDLVARNEPCEVISPPRFVELHPHVPTIVGYFFLVEGQDKRNVGWYEKLEPGRYQLSLMRSIECCHNEWLKAEAISFEVIPETRGQQALGADSP